MEGARCAVSLRGFTWPACISLSGWDSSRTPASANQVARYLPPVLATWRGDEAPRPEQSSPRSAGEAAEPHVCRPSRRRPEGRAPTPWEPTRESQPERSCSAAVTDRGLHRAGELAEGRGAGGWRSRGAWAQRRDVSTTAYFRGRRNTRVSAPRLPPSAHPAAFSIAVPDWVWVCTWLCLSEGARRLGGISGLVARPRVAVPAPRGQTRRVPAPGQCRRRSTQRFCVDWLLCAFSRAGPQRGPRHCCCASRPPPPGEHEAGAEDPGRVGDRPAGSAGPMRRRRSVRPDSCRQLWAALRPLLGLPVIFPKFYKIKTVKCLRGAAWACRRQGLWEPESWPASLGPGRRG